MSRLWTEEEDSFLKTICASGERISAPKIAIRISAKFNIIPPRTKAAIVGRARRLKIDLPIECDRDRKKAAITPQHNGTVYPLRHIAPRPAEPEKPEPRQRQRTEILKENPAAKGVYLLNASDNDCKRPINDPPKGKMHLLRVCGDPVARRPYGGVGYCEACLALMLDRTGGEHQGRFVLPSKKRG